MSIHKDMHGDSLVISKGRDGVVWIECNEEDSSVTELCFCQEVIEKIIIDLQEQLKEKGDE